MSANRRLLTGLIANFAGQGISAIANFAFIPAYISLLGIEAYGLIGLFAVVLTAASLLDAGMTPTLNREMASFHVGQRNATDMRNLLFSVLLLCVAALIVATVLGLVTAPLLARVWLPPSNLPREVVHQSLLLMIVVATLRVIEGMLRGVLLGLQRPILMNIVSSLTVLARAGGVLLPLLLLPSVTTFFLWQAAVCLAGILALATIAFRTIGPSTVFPRFDGASLYRLRGFAGGVFATSLLALLLSQADKIILVKLTSLETFGYYAVATAVSAVLYQGVLPISQAYYPHFTIQYTEGHEAQLSRSYHQASQLVAVLVSSAGSFVFAFAPALLLLWSGKADMAAGASPLLRLLILGSVFHCLMYIPYMLQLAAGWSRLAVSVNSVAACLYLPLLWLVASHHGAIGAAATWAASTFATLMTTSFIMHRRLLRQEWSNWLMRDVARPALAAIATAVLLANVVPFPPTVLGRLVTLCLAAIAIFVVANIASPFSRSLLLAQFWRIRHEAQPARNTGKSKDE
jgi:O-antigen/teichoic acid export membrane protein